jgi:hypothetical protein
LDTNTFDYIYDKAGLTNKVQKAVDNGKIKLFATDVQKQEIEGIKNNEERKQGIQQVIKEIRVEFIETSAAVVALDQQCEKGFPGSKVDSARIVSDEDGELLETVSKLSTECLFKNQADLLIFYTAIKENMDYVVTGNTAHFKKPLERFKMERGTKLQIKNRKRVCKVALR